MLAYPLEYIVIHIRRERLTWFAMPWAENMQPQVEKYKLSMHIGLKCQLYS
jgi:hypothetical protein